ncbi:hypothetical protein [Fusobacterium sp. HC1336]|uniref:hypothetical protein n=1 Tax=Fusobacterium sp. HC1336 TaxID=3171169 RepID=UPI003F22FAC7
MFKSRKEVLNNFLTTTPCLQRFLKSCIKKQKIKNYYVNPGWIKGFKIAPKKPLIAIKFSSFTFSLNLIKGEEDDV